MAAFQSNLVDNNRQGRDTDLAHELSFAHPCSSSLFEYQETVF